MALWKQVELAANIGLSKGHVNVYVQRGKIILNKDKYFDTENIVNKDWLEKRQAKQDGRQPADKLNPPQTGSKFKSIEKKNATSDDIEVEKKVSFFKTSENLKNEKLEEEIKLLKLKIQKEEGRSIPIDFTQRLFELHFKNVSAEFFNVADNYTSIIVSKLNGNRNDLAEFRQVLKKVINESIEEAKKTSKKDLELISKNILIDE
jgi:hypothetical protein